MDAVSICMASHPKPVFCVVSLHSKLLSTHRSASLITIISKTNTNPSKHVCGRCALIFPDLNLDGHLWKLNLCLFFCPCLSQRTNTAIVIYERFDSWWQFPYLVWVLPLEHDKSARNVKLAEEQPVGAEHFAYLKLFLSSNQPNSIENLKRNLMTLLPLLLLTLHAICFQLFAIAYSAWHLLSPQKIYYSLFPWPGLLWQTKCSQCFKA